MTGVVLPGRRSREEGASKSQSLLQPCHPPSRQSLTWSQLATENCVYTVPASASQNRVSKSRSMVSDVRFATSKGDLNTTTTVGDDRQDRAPSPGTAKRTYHFTGGSHLLFSLVLCTLQRVSHVIFFKGRYLLSLRRMGDSPTVRTGPLAPDLRLSSCSGTWNSLV